MYISVLTSASVEAGPTVRLRNESSSNSLKTVTKKKNQQKVKMHQKQKRCLKQFKKRNNVLHNRDVRQKN